MECPAAQEVHVNSTGLCERRKPQAYTRRRNFGIVKHPGTGGTNLTTNQSEYAASPDQIDGVTEQKGGLFSKKDASTAQDQLGKKGFIPVKWHGKCEADKVSMGTYDVQVGKSGMFGLVFDNTFSKQTSKHATFVLLTYPTGAPPQGAHHLPNLQAGPNANASKTSLGRHGSPRLGAVTSDSLDSLHSHNASGRPGTSILSQGVTTPANYHVGQLLKRRRKKGQGYARRFFSLDYATCTLSYYHNRNSSALRGAIPLSLAAIAADELRREISIDSGAEVWHLKASSAKEFSDWAHALERASRVARGLEQIGEPSPEQPHTKRTAQVPPNTQQEEGREWQQVETLVSRVVGTRDALRRLVKDLASQKHTHPVSSSSHLSPGTPVLSEDPDSYFQPAPDKRSFWKRKSSVSPLTAQAFQPTISSALAVPTPSTASTIVADGAKVERRRSKGGTIQEERSVQDHCAALLADLDTVVLEFTGILSNSKRRRLPVPGLVASRTSFESSTSTEEFFDAAEGSLDRSRLLRIDHQSEEDTPASDVDEATMHDSSSLSSAEDDEQYAGTGPDGTSNLFPAKPKSLSPLPITSTVVRRTTIPPSTVLPPSLIAFVRKNVGKDLSTISMPVSANEPCSLLQRLAEQLEYAELLDLASKQKRPEERLLYVTAFAVSQFSATRAKERSIRKPFNPLLGETFELLRSEKEVLGGMRLLVEKVSHRPVRAAMHADSASWSFAQSPAPAQKFWGKSAEVTTEGRVRVALRLPDGTEEHFSWNIATMFLRNVVMGEKYVEPVGTMHVTNDVTGARATIEFRSRGMFGGRGEDVQVETFGPDGLHTGFSLTGTWTSSLRIVEAGRSAGPEIWKAGRLVDNHPSVYGMTVFAAGLNELTELEKGRLPPTDSRLRPDQRLAETGLLEEAEKWKVRLEEAQRRRRRAAEEKDEEHRPRWFVKVAIGQDGDEVWKIKSGKDGYWEERAKGTWTGVEDIFAA